MTYAQYEARVPQAIQVDVAEKMDRWIADGRRDDEIDNLVRSLVLNAYVVGSEDGREQTSRLERNLEFANGDLRRVYRLLDEHGINGLADA